MLFSNNQIGGINYENLHNISTNSAKVMSIHAQSVEINPDHHNHSQIDYF